MLGSENDDRQLLVPWRLPAAAQIVPDFLRPPENDIGLVSAAGRPQAPGSRTWGRRRPAPSARVAA